jgi:hypothetical protein
MKFICVSVLLTIMVFLSVSCNATPASPQETSQSIAEEFVKAEATFQFDGIPDTLKVLSGNATGDGWQFTIKFDSRNAGYGDRSGQALANVITRHTAEITVQDGAVTAAFMDGQWDMINQLPVMEIRLAPIDEVKINILESYPPQISVYIKGGLPDGCSSFHDITVDREGETVNIQVTIQHPKGVNCPAIYTNFEKYVNLGSDFMIGTTYTLNVNDYATTFNGTSTDGEGFAIYLPREGIPPDRMEMLSHVDIADQPVISNQDIITYDAQTHEIKLTNEAFARIANLEVPVSGRSFLVCVDKAPIYWGAFWTPISSLLFDGVTIWQPLVIQESRVITIELGYPAASYYNDTDPRNDPAVMTALEQAGKLVNQQPLTSVEKLPGSFKGYELYSWEAEDEWHFTLITGTNRTKTMEEITSGEDLISETGWVKIHVIGVDGIKDVLNRLPEGEAVFWCDELHTGEPSEIDLQLPPEQITDTIEEYASQCGLDLTRYNRINLHAGSNLH